MATLTAPEVMPHGSALIDALLAPFAHSVFSRKRGVGLLIVAAIATEPRALVLGLAALCGARISMLLLGVTATGMSAAQYAYNAVLVGLLLAQDFALGPRACLLAALFASCCVFVTGALRSLFSFAGWLPLLNVPFVVTAYLSLGLHPQLGLHSADVLRDPLAGWLSPGVALPLQSLGAVVLVPTASAGCLLLLALLVHSRIATLLALASALLVHALLALAHAPVPQLLEQSAQSNAILAAMAIGGVWFVPSRASYTLALVAALLAAFFTLGLSAPVTRLGLPISFLPFDLSVLLLLSAVRQRVADRRPALAEVVAEDPEELLLLHLSRRAASSDPYAPRFFLPFRGAWTCTQGVDGVFTHRGALRYAFDFEVYGDRDGALCSGPGDRREDYYCYGLPVLAAADGTVVAVESAIDDNAIGAVLDDKPWGNHVIVQHAAGLYSVVGHLVPGTPSVYPGQVVRRGALLGYCGNSGRSPRPHLHFQLQSGVSLGSPTLPCRFATAVARAGDLTHFASDLTPTEGLVVRNLEPDGTLGAFFELSPGQTLSYRLGAQLEEVESVVDAWGRTQLRSLAYGSSLLYSRYESNFVSADLLGAQRSVLCLARVALPRVPLELLDRVHWSEWVAGRWIEGPLRGLLWDVLAPFSNRAGVEIVYRASLEQGRLVVVGASRALDEARLPLVTTRAELVHGVGPVVFELCAGQRKRRAERVFSGHDGTRREPTGPVRLQTEAAGLHGSASSLSLGGRS